MPSPETAKARQARFFDAFSIDLWDQLYRLSPLGRALKRIERVAIGRLGVRPLEKVLDIGCGSGDGLRAIASRGGFAYGLDLSSGMLARASRNVEARGHLVRGDAITLPYRAGAFDKIVCANSFHHYFDHRAALREIRRVLKPQGLLVIVDPRRDHFAGRVAVNLVERHLLGFGRVEAHSLEDWRSLLAEAGFSIADVRAGPIWRPADHAEVFVEATR